MVAALRGGDQALMLDGVAMTASAAALNAVSGGVAAGYKIARGQLTTVTAADTVVTGLATVVAVVASLESDPVDDPFMVSAQIGDQAGAPAAGSVIIKSWKNTGGTDPTPLAATTFSKKVNWIAIGT
jgi:3D (Asp-Asp-Asp) domain-containing protein